MEVHVEIGYIAEKILPAEPPRIFWLKQKEKTPIKGVQVPFLSCDVLNYWI
jgi:hypothetical protein